MELKEDPEDIYSKKNIHEKFENILNWIKVQVIHPSIHTKIWDCDLKKLCKYQKSVHVQQIAN